MRGGCLGHVLWRSAFQARRPRRAYPRTSSPVTIATLCTAFQADRPQRNRFAHELHECNEGTGVLQNAPTQRLTPESIKAFILLWIEAAFTQNFTPKNYTYPSLAGITG